jgi:hypothetical protein
VALYEANLEEVAEGAGSAPTAADASDPLLAPYYRAIGDIEKMPVIDTTKTICPECKLIIDGTLYRDGDFVMIRKRCPEHGLTIEKYWEDYEMYMKMRKYDYDGRGLDNPDYPNEGKNCPFDCGICERHKSHSGLINVVVTNRCHLACYYCFFFAKDGEPIYEPTLAELERMFRKLRSQKPIASNAIQLTGGEPTLRPDLLEIVRKAKEAGFDQIQLNTTGINLGLDPELLVRLRYEGVSTLYMSFDGVSKRANPKNHWEVPLALGAARKAGMGLVLVPAVIRTANDHELGPIINFALNNLDVVRAVNFQPVSLVGKMPTGQRERQRITIPGAIKLIEKQTNGVVSREDWFSVPYTGGINKFLEALTGEYKYDLSTHFACGAATYLFLDEGNRVLPVTRFVDAAGLVEHLQSSADEMQGKGGIERKLIAVKALAGALKFIDKEKQPKSVNFGNLLKGILTRHDFNSMAELQMKTLFLGMMHFQDEYNYDIKRVEKCEVHYTLPDGRVIPFCTFNVIPELYRDKAQRQFAIPGKEWAASHPGWSYASDKYRRDVKELEARPEYDQTYGHLTDFFSLPVNAQGPGAGGGAQG